MSDHILVVEDSALIRRLVNVCLRSLGRRIVEAEDGVTGLQAILEDPPSLVVLDIGLPRLDGWEVLDRIRGDAATRHVPVLVLTAHAQESTRRRADSQGADAFMTKPFEPDELRALALSLIDDSDAPRTTPAIV